MTDTVFYKIDLLVNGHEKINDLCPVVIEHTTEVCCENAVPLTWIICGTIGVIVFLVLLALIAWRLIGNYNTRKNNRLEWKNQERDRCYKLKQDYQSKVLDAYQQNNKVSDYIEEIGKVVDAMKAKNNTVSEYFEKTGVQIAALNVCPEGESQNNDQEILAKIKKIFEDEKNKTKKEEKELQEILDKISNLKGELEKVIDGYPKILKRYIDELNNRISDLNTKLQIETNDESPKE